MMKKWQVKYLPKWQLILSTYLSYGIEELLWDESLEWWKSVIFPEKNKEKADPMGSLNCSI